MRNDELRRALAEMLQSVAGVLIEGANKIAPEVPQVPVRSDGPAAMEAGSPAPPEEVLRALKRTTHSSWIMLAKGLRDLAHLPVEHSTDSVANSSRSFARRAIAATGLSADELLDLLIKRGWAAEEYAATSPRRGR